jgi:NADH:ubiquinone oxidoreductase subunit H
MFDIYDLLVALINFLVTLPPIIILVAFVTLLERKVMGSIQKRRGPNVIGYFGILQPFADGIKLLVKEPIFPYKSNKILFWIAPLLTLFSSSSNLIFLPLSDARLLGNFEYDLLFISGISSFGVYGIIISGWASNSKYAFLGALRAAAQMISYELVLVMTCLPVIVISKSSNLQTIIESQKQIWFVFTMFPSSICFYIALLAETNRAPFDLPEAEGELVAGYNVEYSAFYFAFFYLGEYISICFMAILFTILFSGGWYIFGYKSYLIFSIKIVGIIYSVIWVRASLPRYRFDQLIRIGWKVLLPSTTGSYMYIIGWYIFLNICYVTGVWSGGWANVDIERMLTFYAEHGFFI